MDKMKSKQHTWEKKH